LKNQKLITAIIHTNPKSENQAYKKNQEEK